MRIVFGLVIAGLLGGCQGYDAGAPAAAGEDVTLEVRAHRAVAGLRVGFAGVSEDSRCPPGVQCVWAGRAVARVWLVAAGGDTTWLEPAITGGVDVADTTSAEGAVVADGWSVRLMRLVPHPARDVAIDPSTIARRCG